MEFKPNDRYVYPINDNLIIPQIKNIDKIYHYTNPCGFKGILENKTLRFTNIGCLNDSAEVVDGVNEYWEYMKRYSEIPTMHEEDTESTINSIRKNTYILCATTDYDNLAMWRYYTKGNDTNFINGFNIEFACDKLIHSILKLNFNTLQGAGISYGLAIYEKEDKTALISDGLLQLDTTIGNGIGKVVMFLGVASLKKDYSPEKEQAFAEHKTETEEKLKNTPKYKMNIFTLRQSNENDICFDNGINFSAVSFSKNRTFSYEKEFRIVITFTDEQVTILKSEGVIKEYTNQGIRKSFIDLSFDINAITGFNSAPLMEEIHITKGIAVKNSIPELENIAITPSASSVRF